MANALDTLFVLLREMLLDRRKDGTVMRSAIFHRLEMITSVSYAALALLFAALLVGNRNSPSPDALFAITLSGLAAIVFGSAYLLSALMHLAWHIWQASKRPYENLITQLQIDLQADARYLTRLAAYDKPTLQYALLQYRHRWDVADGRLSLLIGDLRKIGLFPAFAASAISASMLIKNDSSPWLWLPLLVLATLHLLLLPLHNRERSQQVAELLRHAIEQATASPVAAMAGDALKNADDNAEPARPRTPACVPHAPAVQGMSTRPAAPLPSTA